MTRPIHGILCFGALVVALLIPGQAQAQAFLFNVPMSLKSIHPKYTVVKVICKVNGQEAPIGQGTSYADLTAGGFNGVLSVPVDPGPGKSALDAKTYGCEAWYCTSRADTFCADAMRHSLPETGIQPGAPFTPVVGGSIQ